MLSFLHSPTLTSIHDTGKTIALTRPTFVGKVMSLLFNMLSRLVINLIVPENKKVLKKSWRYFSRTSESAGRAHTGQIWKNLSIKRNYIDGL